MGAAPSGCRTSRQSISSPRSATVPRLSKFDGPGPDRYAGPARGDGCLQRSEAAVPNSEFPPLSRSACTTQSDARVAQSAACTTLRACASPSPRAGPFRPSRDPATLAVRGDSARVRRLLRPGCATLPCVGIYFPARPRPYARAWLLRRHRAMRRLFSRAPPRMQRSRARSRCSAAPARVSARRSARTSEPSRAR